MDEPKIASRRTWLIVSGIVVLGIALWVVTLVPGWLSGESDPATSPAAENADSSRRIQATVFYLTEDGSALAPITREVPYGATPAEQARHIVAVQVAKAPDGKVSPIPATTQVRAVFIGAKGEAYVDLSPEVSSANFGGSLDELLAVYAIVNAITTNLPDVKAVQILVDGKEVDTLAGHVDLREPITRSDAWVRKGQ
jgi:spore germination protein GerM